MSGYIPGSQHFSSKGLVSALSRLESNTSSVDSLLKEAAASAQGYLNDDEESLSGSSVELESNHSQGSIEKFVPLNLMQDSSSFEFSVLPSRYKDIVENLKSKISYQTNYFSLESKPEGNDVRLNCKICRKVLHITKVEEHTVDQEHLRNLAMKCNTASAVDSKENRKPRTWGAYDSLEDVNNNGQKNSKKANFALSSPQTELNENSSTAVKSLTSGEKLAKDLTDKLKDYMNYFESYENRWYELCFSCKICWKSFPSKNGKLHIYTNLHLRNLRKGLSVAKLETLDARNTRTVKSLIKQYNNRLYFFQLIHDGELDELYFVCKVCSVVLTPECLVDHIYSPEHSKNVQENPVVLNYDTLSDYNKEVIKELTGIIRVFRIKDFTFVYRIGTEELRLYCKCCQLTLIPEKVEDHVYLTDHVLAAKAELYQKRKTFEGDASTNNTAPSKTGLTSVQVASLPQTKSRLVRFDSLNRTNKAIVEKLESVLGSELLYFDLASTDTSELHFKCKLCDVAVKYNVVTHHVEHSDHAKNRELLVLFKDFISMEESSKKMLRKLYSEVGSKLASFRLASSFDSVEPRFTCTFCNITLCSDFVANHLQTKNHQKLSGEGGSKGCGTTVSRHSSQERDSKSSSSSDKGSVGCASPVSKVMQQRASGNASTVEGDSKSCVATNSEDSLERRDSKSSTDSESTLNLTVKNTDCLAVGMHSPSLQGRTPDLSLKSAENSVEGVSRKHDDATLMSDLKHPSGPSETQLVSQEKSAETVAPNLKNINVTKSSALDDETSQSTPKCNVSSLESNGITCRPASSAFGKNSSESESDVITDSYEEILEVLLDKVGIKITNFDFILTGGSNELWFCTFCHEMVQPDTVESHVNHKAYLKWSNDSKEEIVKKFLNNVGNKISDFDVSVSVGFSCKFCGANVNTETVVDHIGSEEHRCHGSQKVTAKSSQDRNVGSPINIAKMAEETASRLSMHFADPTADLRSLNYQSSTVASDTLTFQFESRIPEMYGSRRDEHSSGKSRHDISNTDLLFYLFVSFYFIVFVYILFYFKNFLMLE